MAFLVAMHAVAAFAQIGTNAPHAGDIPAALRLGKIVQGPPLNEIDWESLKGKLVVLEFWNTACKPCVESIPHLNELVDHFKDKPVVFLSICDDDEAVLRKFLKLHPMKSWLALDGPDNATERRFHLKGYGLIALINPAGRIVTVSLPAYLQSKHLDEILAGKPCSLPAIRAMPASDMGSSTNEIATPK